MTRKQQPTVSEQQEGKPWFEWLVAICVVVASIIAGIGHATAATAIIAIAAVGASLIRLIQKDASPWKIRSVRFDVIVGLTLACISVALYLSIRFGLN